HLPGHSPGSIGLWEERTGILFSGDAIYDGPLIADCYHSDLGDYVATMVRLRDLPATVVHGGHFPSFGRVRLRELAEAFLKAKGALWPAMATMSARLAWSGRRSPTAAPAPAGQRSMSSMPASVRAWMRRWVPWKTISRSVAGGSAH